MSITIAGKLRPSRQRNDAQALPWHRRLSGVPQVFSVEQGPRDREALASVHPASRTGTVFQLPSLPGGLIALSVTIAQWQSDLNAGDNGQANPSTPGKLAVGD